RAVRAQCRAQPPEPILPVDHQRSRTFEISIPTHNPREVNRSYGFRLSARIVEPNPYCGQMRRQEIPIYSKRRFRSFVESLQLPSLPEEVSPFAKRHARKLHGKPRRD
ncbi:MAG: hypothetical protein WBE56_21690, partial [Terracidiphilus sp.]